jgi:tRNA(adenine34) deaminase
VHPDWIFDDEDRRFMALALAEARAASSSGEIPVGCVVVRRGDVVGRAGNRRRHTGDPAAHAEILALRDAGTRIGDWRLDGCTLYVTLEPCPMCVSACRQARIDLIVWGAADPTMGACGTVIDLAEDPRLGPPVAHRGGLEADACGEILRSFFANSRRSS